MAEVRLQEGETLENALRRFKRKVLQEGIIQDVKRHAFYLKPGQKRRLKQVLARKRNRKRTAGTFIPRNNHRCRVARAPSSQAARAQTRTSST